MRLPDLRIAYRIDDFPEVTEQLRQMRRGSRIDPSLSERVREVAEEMPTSELRSRLHTIAGPLGEALREYETAIDGAEAAVDDLAKEVAYRQKTVYWFAGTLVASSIGFAFVVLALAPAFT